MKYTFEKSSVMEFGDRWQVRLKGEFIMYSHVESSKFVDGVLKEEGWDSREQYYNYLIGGEEL